jgi:IclR family KDG regulon transcriptional repressor
MQEGEGMEHGEVKVKSLRKALDILNYFTEKPLLGVTEISEYFGLNKSTVHNILSTLQALEYLEQDEASGKYRLGIQIFNLSKAMGDNYSITKIAMPYMQEIANQTRERVYLAVPYRYEVLYLEAMYPADSVELMRSILGERAQMYCTGLGKAMLSYMGQAYAEEYLEQQELKAYTETSITDRNMLRDELARTRQRGYAIDDMEHEFGIKCIAMPILDRGRNVYAAVSISGLATHFTEEHIAEWAILLKKYVNKIESRL